MNNSELVKYEHYLRSEERSANTIEKYLRDVRVFFRFLGGRTLCKEVVVCFKEQLSADYAPASVGASVYYGFSDVNRACARSC